MDFIQNGTRFYMGENPAKPLAEITFEEKEGYLLVDHTFTDASLRGRGIARKLVERVADYAREKGLKLRASCPYARKVLAEAAFRDLYAESGE